MSEGLASATAGQMAEMPALAMTTSKLVMLCFDRSSAMASLGSVSEMLSILTIMRELEGFLGSSWSERLVGWVGFRTLAITMLFGRKRYAATSPLPIPAMYEVPKRPG